MHSVALESLLCDLDFKGIFDGAPSKVGTMIGRTSVYQEPYVDYAEKKISSSLFRARRARDSNQHLPSCPPYPLTTRLGMDGWSFSGKLRKSAQEADLFREVVYNLPHLSASRDPRWDESKSKKWKSWRVLLLERGRRHYSLYLWCHGTIPSRPSLRLTQGQD